MAFIAIPIFISGSELLLAAAAAAGTVFFAWKAGKVAQDVWERTSSKSSDGGRRGGCPPHDWYTGKDMDHLAKTLGLDRKTLGANIHSLKKQLEGNPDVAICKKCGDVASPKSGDIIGNLKD